MKKVIIAGLSALALTALATSCTSVTPGYGGGFLGIGSGACAAISNDGNVSGSKVGTAEAKFLFGAIPLSNDGDITLATAMKNGKITKINSIETKKVNFLNILVTKTTIVTGE